MIPKYEAAYFNVSADYILKRLKVKPEIAIVLGSALGTLADEIEEPVVIDYKDIPNFLVTTVKSHAGKLIIGKLEGRHVICMSGRFHYYEGYDFEELVTPIRVFHAMGVKSVILTNAAGAINESYVPGDIMIIKDHINLMGASPMRGPNMEQFGPRFFDVSDMYTRALRDTTKKVAEALGLDIKEGVYYFAPGPHFETPAEIRVFRNLGADAVGMSTITEALTAAHCNMNVLGLSLMTNMAAGILDEPITSEEVGQVANKSVEKFKKLLREVVKAI